MKDSVVGALAGWKHEPSTGGLKLTLQLAGSADDFQEKDFQRVIVALDPRQLRSLARDMARAAAEQNIELFARKRGFMQWLGLA